MPQAPRVTVVITQRERFSTTRRNLESVYAGTRIPFRLIYVDAGSPRRTRNYLRRTAREKGFLLIRRDRFLSPSQARNLALPHVSTEFVALVDNDVLVQPGWLEALVRCADETGAAGVHPVTLIGELETGEIHAAHCDAEIVDVNGSRRFTETHGGLGLRLAEARGTLRRQPAGMLEFHACLLRMDAVRTLGPLDEQLLSRREHVDYSFRLRQAGYTIYFEPASVITYLSPPPLRAGDFQFFLLRWSREWQERSLDRFSAKWNLDPEDPKHRRSHGWGDAQRRLFLGAWKQRLERVFGGRIAARVERMVAPPVERLLTARAMRKWEPVPPTSGTDPVPPPLRPVPAETR